MKKVKYSLIGVVLFSVLVWLFIVITGNQHLFKAVSTTYLVGKTGPTIDEYKIFENREVNTSKHQPWNVSNAYNQNISNYKLSDFDTLEPAALLVIKNDSIVYEAYGPIYEENSVTNSFSMAKAFTSILVGCAIDDGLISSVDDQVGNYLPQFKNKPELTIKALLTMSSGINFDENYSSPIGYMAKAYYGSDLKKLNENFTVTETPNQVFKYLGGNTLLLSFIVEKVTGKNISDYFSEKIWKPIGAKNTAYWSLDAENGNEKAYCCFNSNARDFARIGKLFLNKGKWNGKQIVSEKYVQQSITPASHLKDENGKNVDFYGFQWWIENYKGNPVFYARGIRGQYIIVLPELNIILVRLGHKRLENLPNKQHTADFYDNLNVALKFK